MSIQRMIYNTFFKRTSTFLLTIVAGAFIFERALDIGTDALFDSYNKGVSIKSYLYYVT